MIVNVFVEPHERRDALEAYGDLLTVDQKDQIDSANKLLRFRLTLDLTHKLATVVALDP
jgi:hypothetical protein